MDTTTWRPINVWTWAMAALFIAGPAVAVVLPGAGNDDGVGDSLAVLFVMLVLNLGLALAPFVAERHWLRRLPVLLLMLPAAGVLSVLVLGTLLEAVSRGMEHDFRAWSVGPALLALCVYAATGTRLLVVGTPFARLVRPTPRPDGPTDRPSSPRPSTADWR